MSLKEELKHEMQNLKRDMEKEVHKVWTIDYKGHCIEVINQMKEEFLIIDGITVDENKRKSLFSHIIPYTKLSGTLTLEDGKKHKVSVKIGGYIKLNCIIKIDHEIIINKSEKLEFLPWEHKEKIVPYIQKQVQANHRIVDGQLPDDDYFFGTDKPRLDPGLFDIIVNEPPTPLFMNRLMKLFKEQLEHPTVKTRKSTYDQIIFDHIAIYRDELIEQLGQAELDGHALQQEALWLLEHAAHRDVVKFAILVLGFTNCEEYQDLLYTIGLHDEFTPYVIFAIRNGGKGVNDQIWSLVQSVQGMGKITAIELVEAKTPEMKYWLLTKGCENRKFADFIALRCATKGELDVALYEKDISKELYTGAAMIIEGLLDESNPDGIDNYPYAAAVLTRFLYHAHTHCENLEDFYPFLKISEFLHADEEIWEERLKEQWKQHERTLLQEALQPFLDNPKWSHLAFDALKQDSEVDFRAIKVAQFYQLDITSLLLKILKKEPSNSALFAAIMETKDIQLIKELCAFAETRFPLPRLTIEEQECLEFIIQDLQEFEGVGLPLIQVALESENERLRWQALTVLENWSPSVWNQPAIQDALKTITKTTKDKEERRFAKQLLSR
ncbi:MULTISPECIES: hypothetical protein [Niallia]|uniref:Uncharacterized protein n=1 Tax=Niallia alba TaxID=2729105 RepID=A0A7Y0PNU0_9BACI|nr:MULTISPECIES: hypothetical protein [Niallia]NMO79458.1 hypothetical protein [Niallia alba]UTI42768.1 hypothetical protein NKG37_03190 [Niallia sp. RD1]